MLLIVMLLTATTAWAEQTVTLSLSPAEVNIGDELIINAAADGFSGDVEWEWLGDDNVTVNEPEPPSLYDVIVRTDGNGTAEAAPNEAVPGETITLTVTPKQGYMLSAITVNNGEVEVTGNSFVMPKSNAFVDVTFEPIYYIDANGTMHYAEEATVLDGSETVLNAGWYVVNSNLTYDHALQLGSGTINIILADGKKMSIGTEDSYIHNSSGIVPTDLSTIKSDLCIYGQTAGNTDQSRIGDQDVQKGLQVSEALMSVGYAASRIHDNEQDNGYEQQHGV